MSDFLAQMAASSAARAATAGPFHARDLEKPVWPLVLQGFDLIAEIKDRSPAEGELAGARDNRAERARQYAHGGAAAISVLTEPARFAGSLEHLAEVVRAVPGVPVMRKDFLVAVVQVEEARAMGASGVLLIVAMLSDKRLRAMLDCAAELGLFVLLESFGREDLKRLHTELTPADHDRANRGQLLFGVNTRNLRTLEVDAGRLENLVAELPAGPKVAESGLHTAEDTARVAHHGYSLALVGTALMKSENPAALVAAMKAAGTRELSV